MYESIKELRGFNYKLPLLSADLTIHDINYCTNVDFDVPRMHPFGEIYYGLRGLTVISTDDRDYELQEGDLLYIGPSVVRHCMFRPTAIHAYFLYSFRLEPRAWTEGVKREYVEDEVRLLENMQGHDVLQARDTCGCLQEIESFCVEQDNGRMGGIVKLYGYLTNFFISAIQSFSEIRKRPDLAELINSEGIRNRAVRIADHVWKYCDQDISIQTVATDLSYSRRHVQRIISEYFGMGFAELLTQYRLGKAKTLLCYGNDSLERVAQKSGFTDARTLRRKFREQMNLTPSEYRTRMKQRQLAQSQRNV